MPLRPLSVNLTCPSCSSVNEQNPAVYADGTTGDALNVGQTYCFDANYNNWSFDHAPYGLVWLALSLCGLVWVKFMLSIIDKEPDIVQRERKLRDIISHCGADQDEMAHGLSVSQVCPEATSSPPHVF